LIARYAIFALYHCADISLFFAIVILLLMLMPLIRLTARRRQRDAA